MFKTIARCAFIAVAALTFTGGGAVIFDAAHAQRSNQEVLNVQNEPLPAGASLEQVDRAVLAVLSARGWLITAHTQGSVDAQYAPRDFSATIRVTYTAEVFSIAYVTSEGLRYHANTRQIHPSYNHWIDGLRFDIPLYVRNSMVIAAPALAP